ncbi:MAG: hypothetical protein LBP86_06010 [Azoarcus sp.]|nr:hypothetical protein [Azoarcus sp.]
MNIGFWRAAKGTFAPIRSTEWRFAVFGRRSSMRASPFRHARSRQGASRSPYSGMIGGDAFADAGFDRPMFVDIAPARRSLRVAMFLRIRGDDLNGQLGGLGAKSGGRVFRGRVFRICP